MLEYANGMKLVGIVDGWHKEQRDFLMRLATEGGSIVCTNTLTPEQINTARVEGRMYVNSDGIGFVLIQQGCVVHGSAHPCEECAEEHGRVVDESVEGGWKLVPLEPTLAMLDAGLDQHDGSAAPEDELANAYRAMLTAAPVQRVDVAFDEWRKTDPVAKAHADSARDLALIEHGWQAHATLPHRAEIRSEISAPLSGDPIQQHRVSGGGNV